MYCTHNNQYKISAIIVSAGNSTRMGGINKQFLMLKGIPVIVHSIKAFNDNDSIDEIVVVTRECDINNIERVVDFYNFNKVKNIVVGGNTRQESVLNGVKAVDDCDFIAIHDGARPLVSQNVINNTLSDAVSYDAAATGVKVKDTVKVVNDKSFITSTPDREYMRFVQTPQIFRKDLYIDAVNKVENSSNFTDDCMLIEAYGKSVYLSLGDYNNIKITTPDDIELAEHILKRRNNL